MNFALIVIAAVVLASCTTYKGAEPWRLSTCNQIVDVDERADCEAEATRPENEYKSDLDDSTRN